MGLLLADYMQDRGCSQTECKNAMYMPLYLSPGFGDFETGTMLSRVWGRA